MNKFNELSNEPVKVREDKISQYWKEIDLLKRSVETREPDKPYIFTKDLLQPMESLESTT